MPAPRTIPHLINGQLVTAGTRSGKVFNPATGEQSATVPLAAADFTSCTICR